MKVRSIAINTPKQQLKVKVNLTLRLRVSSDLKIKNEMVYMWKVQIWLAVYPQQNKLATPFRHFIALRIGPNLHGLSTEQLGLPAPKGKVSFHGQEVKGRGDEINTSYIRQMQYNWRTGTWTSEFLSMLIFHNNVINHTVKCQY